LRRKKEKTNRDFGEKEESRIEAPSFSQEEKEKKGNKMAIR